MQSSCVSGLGCLPTGAIYPCNIGRSPLEKYSQDNPVEIRCLERCFSWDIYNYLSNTVYPFLLNFRASNLRTVKTSRVFVLSHSIHGEPQDSMVLLRTALYSEATLGLWGLPGKPIKYMHLGGNPRDRDSICLEQSPRTCIFKAPWWFSCIGRYGNHPMKHTSFLSHSPGNSPTLCKDWGNKPFLIPRSGRFIKPGRVALMHSPGQKNTIQH